MPDRKVLKTFIHQVFAGYRAQLACLKADIYQKIFPSFIRNSLQKIISQIPESTKKRNLKHIRWIKRFLSFASLPRFERYLAASNTSLTDKNFNNYYSEAPFCYTDSFYFKKEKELFNDNKLSYLTKICLNYSRVYLPDHNLTYSDKAAMAASVEGRPPLTDHRIFEYMFTLPPNFRINKNIQKYLLKKVSSKYLPDEIINRPKAPFSAPLRAWLKGPLTEMVNDILSVDSIKKRGIYNHEYIANLIKKNKKGLEDNSQIIWRLITNETWFRTFFD